MGYMYSKILTNYIVFTIFGGAFAPPLQVVASPLGECDPSQHTCRALNAQRDYKLTCNTVRTQRN